MNNFICPYCSSSVPLIDDTCHSHELCFHSDGFFYSNTDLSDKINITFTKCPTCDEVSIKVIGIGEKVKDTVVHVKPISSAKQFPKYIPESIRNDYSEAYAIMNLSPKASATLCRRCLQGMIRDFHKIKENSLASAIKKLESLIPAPQWKVIDGIRRIGNIGAHMEKDINLIVDIEPDEAYKLIQLIEILLEQWYVNKHEQEKLYADIMDIDENKQDQRNKIE